MAAQEVDELAVRLVRLAGGHGDGPRLPVECYVYDEIEPREARGGQHLFVDGIAIEHTGACRRGGEHVEGVVAHDALVTRDRRQDRLAAAREAGELVGFDLPEGDPQIGRGHAPVEQQRHAACGVTDLDEVAGAGVVVGDS